MSNLYGSRRRPFLIFSDFTRRRRQQPEERDEMSDQIIDGQIPGDGAQPPVKTFSQADMDRIITERLSREREKYADFDTLKTKAAELDSMKAANQTEAEKVAAAIKDRDARIEAAEKKASEAEQKALGLMRQTRVIGAASTLGAYDPADANFVQATASIDPASATAEADIRAALEALKAAKPYLFRPAGARLEAFNPAAGNQGSAETDQQRVQRLLRMGNNRNFGPLG
jgi:hypothetical protein